MAIRRHFGTKGFIICTVLLGSLSIPNETSFGQELNLPDSDLKIIIQDNSKTEIMTGEDFNDWVKGEYWSEDMMWAISQGLIKGYQDQVHPQNKKKGKGNWLNPYGKLTEAQMITVMFRYEKPQELANIKTKDKNFWASDVYQMAEKYKLPVKGSLKNKKVVDRGVTRGDLARSLATLHTGRNVSTKEAVQFMYDLGLSNGKTGKKTYADFGVDDNLVRAHIVTFMKRYDDFKQTGKDYKPKEEVKKDPPKTDSTKYKRPTKTNKAMSLYYGKSTYDGTAKSSYDDRMKNGKINVYHGTHTYGSKNQKEYDKVMDIVYEALEGYDKVQLSSYEDTTKHYQEYLNGANDIIRDRSNPKYRNTRNMDLLNAEKIFGPMLSLGVDKKKVEEVRKLWVIATNLQLKAKDPKDGSPESAYDALVRGLVDCDAYSNTIIAFFDAAGYNTMILGYPGVHAIPVVEIDGFWYNIESSPNPIDIKKVMHDSNWKIVTPPTNGKKLK